MEKLLFVTPVYRRPEITKICLEQRANVIEALKEFGLEAQCAVIGDEQNLAVARDLGMVAIPAPNVLGRKFNDGHQYAVENGYDWSMPIGSDQFIDPRVLADLAGRDKRVVQATQWYIMVHSDGDRCLQFKHKKWAGKIFPRILLKPNPRPCDENIMRQCDTSTHNGVARANRQRLQIRVDFLEHGPFEYVNFSSGVTQVSDWDRFVSFAHKSGVEESLVPWEGIENVYGAELVGRVKEYYTSGRSLTA